LVVNAVEIMRGTGMPNEIKTGYMMISMPPPDIVPSAVAARDVKNTATIPRASNSMIL